MLAAKFDFVHKIIILKKFFNDLNHLLISSGKAGTAKTNYNFCLFFYHLFLLKISRTKVIKNNDVIFFLVTKITV